MSMLTVLRLHQSDAEFDAGVWLDDHDRLRKPVRFLAHHPVARVAVLVLVSPFLAIAASIWAVREASRVVLRAHEIAGEGSAPCRQCVTSEADRLAKQAELTYEQVCQHWDALPKDGEMS